MLVIICRVGQKPRTVSPGIERPVDGIVCDVTSEHHWARVVCCFQVESCAHEPIRSTIFAAYCVCSGPINCDGEDLPSLYVCRRVRSIEEHGASGPASIEKTRSDERRFIVFIRVKLIPLVRIKYGGRHGSVDDNYGFIWRNKINANKVNSRRLVENKGNRLGEDKRASYEGINGPLQ
jgi:hypothetical protein